jgi:hypothetical protein
MQKANLFDHLPISSPGATLPEALAVPIRKAPAISGLSIPTIYREAAKKNLILIKYGRSTLVDMASLRAFLASLPRASIRKP